MQQDWKAGVVKQEAPSAANQTQIWQITIEQFLKVKTSLQFLHAAVHTGVYHKPVVSAVFPGEEEGNRGEHWAA